MLRLLIQKKIGECIQKQTLNCVTETLHYPREKRNLAPIKLCCENPSDWHETQSTSKRTGPGLSKILPENILQPNDLLSAASLRNDQQGEKHSDASNYHRVEPETKLHDRRIIVYYKTMRTWTRKVLSFQAAKIGA